MSTYGAVPEFEVLVGDKKYVAQIGVIDSFHLGPEDHGIYTAQVGISGHGWGQSLPAYSFDEWDESLKKRIPSLFGMRFIMELTNRLGSPETAKGVKVIVLREKSYGLIEGFSRLNDDGSYDTPLIFKDLSDEYFPNK